MAVPSMPVKQWNFLKAKWSHYIALTNKFAKTLLPPDSLDVDAAYQDFCNTIKKAAKKTIPCRYQNNYVLCWDAECESLYKTFLQSPQGDNSSLAATALCCNQLKLTTTLPRGTPRPSPTALPRSNTKESKTKIFIPNQL